MRPILTRADFAVATKWGKNRLLFELEADLSGYPFTHTTCLSVCTISTRSACAAITASMSL
jgi:hypothetical protein